MAISTNGTVLARVAGALYNTQMSNATYKEVASLDPSSLVDVLYARDFNGSTDLAVATSLVSNLGLTAVTGLANWVAAQLTTAGSHKGAKVVELLNGFANMTADATYGAYATAFNTKVDAALALSQTTDNKGGTFASAGVVVVADATFTLSGNIDAVVGGAGNDTINASQATLQSGDALVGGSGTDTLAIVDTGTASWSVPVVANSGIEIVSLKNLNQAAAVAGVSEKSKVSFQNIGANETLVINGLTITAGGAGGNAADIAAALVAHTGSTSNTVGTATVSGTNTDASWSITAGPDVGSVYYTAAGTAANVTDLSATGTAQTGIKQTTSYTLTAATTITKAITFTINGNTVTTAAAGATTATAAAALANAINAYAGSQVAKSDGVAVVTVSSSTPISLGGFTGNSDATLAVAAGGLAPSTVTVAMTHAAAAATDNAITFTYNGVALSAAVATAATIAAQATAVAGAINAYAGSTVATTILGSSAGDTVSVTSPNGVVLGNFATNNAGSTFGTVTSVATSQGYTAAAPVAITTTQGVTAVLVAAAGADSMDGSKFADATSIINDASTGDVSFTNLLTTQAVTIKGNGASTNGATTATWATTVTAPVLNITGGTTGTAGTVTLAAAATTSLLTVNSSNGKASTTDATGLNTIGAVTATSAGSSTSTLAIHAASSLTTGTIATNASALTVDGAGKTVTLGLITGSNLTSIDASGMSAGGVSVTMLPGITSFKGGAGADTVTTAATTATSAAIDGGAGVADILVLASTNDVTTTTKAAQYVNFEILRNKTSGSVDASLFSGITSVQSEGTGAAFSNLNATQAAAVTARGTLTNATLTLKDATGANDVLTLTASSITGQTTASDVTGLGLTGVETVNFRNSSPAADTLSFAHSTGTAGTTNVGLKNIVITGAKGVTVDVDSAGANTTYTNQVTTLVSVDASGLTAQPTGTNTLTFKDTTGGHALASGLIITGSAGDDVVSLGGTTGTNTLASGVIATINTGSGNDAVTVSAGQLYTSGSGYLVVNGGDNGIAGDTLTISDSTAGTVSDNTWTHVSGVENLAFTNTGALSLTAGSYFNSAFVNGVTITDGATTSSAVTLDLSTYTGVAKITNVGTTGIQTFVGGSGADTIIVTSAIAGTGAASVNVSGGAGNDTISVTDASAISTAYSIVVNGGTGVDKITLADSNAATAASYVKIVVNVGDSTVGNADSITGFYEAGSTRKVDTLDFTGSAIKPNAGFAAVAVTGNTLAELNVAVSTAGLISFAGTKAANLTAAQVESFWTTDIAPRLNNLETALWADANASDTQYGNTLVFNHNLLGDSEVILVGMAGTATGDAAATAHLVGLA